MVVLQSGIFLVVLLRILLAFCQLVPYPAFAWSPGECPPQSPGCSEEGIMWILVPVAVLLHFCMIYLFLGGPRGIFDRFVGGDTSRTARSRAKGGGIQVGFPVAVALSFPVIIALAVIDKLVATVGFLHFAAVIGVYWCLLAWLWRRRNRANSHAGRYVADSGEDMGFSAGDADMIASVVDSSGKAEEGLGFRIPELGRQKKPGSAARPLVAEEFAPLSRLLAGASLPAATGSEAKVPSSRPAAVSSSEKLAGTVQRLAGQARSTPVPAPEPVIIPKPRLQPLPDPVAQIRPPADIQQAGKDQQALLKQLEKTYMWDEIGLGNPFKDARKLSNERLLTVDDEQAFGAGVIHTMRSVAREAVQAYLSGTGFSAHPARQELAGEVSLGDVDEYLADVMKRMMYSVLYDRERLFIDQTDVEIFGEDLLGCLYRIALYEHGQVSRNYH